MSDNIRKFNKGLQIEPVASTAIDSKGEMEVLSTGGKLNYHNGTTASPVVTETHTATLTNKTLSGNTATNLVSGSGTLTLNTSGTATVPNATDTLVGKATTDTLTNKTISGTSNTITIRDTSFTVQDDGDATKQGQLDASGITAGNTRVISIPDANGTIALTSNTQTFSNKTLDNTNTITVKDTLLTLQDDGDTSKQLRFQLSGISTSTTRTLTIPDASTTILGTDSTQTIQNKTLDNSNTVTVKDTLFTIGDNADATKQVVFEVSGVTAGNVRTLTVPDASITLVGTSNTQTLTNKTLTGNTAVNLISGSGTLTLNTTGTATVPNATDTLVGKATTDTLTNKTISGASNTFSNIPAGTALTGQVPIANGGTGANSKSTGFDALSPMTTGGDLIYGGASGTGTRLANGSAGQVLQSAGTTAAPVWFDVGSYTESLQTSATSATTSTQYSDIVSITLAAGTYDLTGIVTWNGQVGVTQFQNAITTTSGNSSTGISVGVNEGRIMPISSGDGSICIASYRVTPVGSTTYYLKAQATYSATAPLYRGRLSAVRWK